MIFYFIYFLVASWLAFFIPGDLFVSRIKTVNGWQRVVLSYILGIVFFASQGFLFGFLQARFATYIYLLMTAVIWIFLNRRKMRQLISRSLSYKPKFDKWMSGLFIVGVITQMLTLLPMGVNWAGKLYFCCNLPDSLYHTALTQQLTRSFPPFEPGMSGVVVHSYHYFTNLMYADLIRVFHLPLMQTQFEFGGILFTVLLGLSLLSLGKTLKLSIGARRWLLFLLFFSGDLVFWLFLLLGRGFNFDVRGLHDATRLWFSPPRVIAMIVFFGGLDLFLHWIKKPTKLLLVLTALVWGSLAGFKIYVAIFVLSGLFFLTLFDLLRRRWRSPYILLFILTTIISLLIYLPVNGGAGGFQWNGLWRFENFFADPTTINLVRLEVARVHFLNVHNIILAAVIDTFYILGYIVLNYGVLLIGLFQTRKTLALIPRQVHIFVFSGTLVSLILGFFFIQNPGYANTSQFLITVEIIVILYAAIAADHWQSKLKGKVGWILLLIFISLTMVRPVSSVGKNIYKVMHRQMFFIEQDEVDALNFLRTKTPSDSLVLLDPFIASENLCYYIPILSERKVFLCGKSIMEDHGVDVKTRYDEVVKINRASYNQDTRVGQYLRKDKIDYIYVRNLTYTFDKKIVAAYATPVFTSRVISIYKVDKKY